VIYKLIPGLIPQIVEDPLPPKFVQSLQQAAQELEQQGVAGITSSCGLLFPYQQTIAQAVRIPVFISSLIQIPLLGQLLKAGQKLVVMTLNPPALQRILSPSLFDPPLDLIICGPEPDGELCCGIFDNREEIDVSRAEREVAEVAERLKEEHRAIGAILLECVNLSPYAPIIQQIIRVPIFDIITLTNLIYQALDRRSMYED